MAADRGAVSRAAAAAAAAIMGKHETGTAQQPLTAPAMGPSWICPVCRWTRDTPVSHQVCVARAVGLVGQLMLRWGGGLEGDPFRAVGAWVGEAEDQARQEWVARTEGVPRGPTRTAEGE